MKSATSGGEEVFLGVGGDIWVGGFYEFYILLGKMEKVCELGGGGGGDVRPLAASIVVEWLVGNMNIVAFGKDFGLSGYVFINMTIWEGDAVPKRAFVELGPEVEGDILLKEKLL